MYANRLSRVCQSCQIEFIEWNLADVTWCLGVMEHVKLAQIRWLAIGEWQVTEPEIKL